MKKFQYAIVQNVSFLCRCDSVADLRIRRFTILTNYSNYFYKEHIHTCIMQTLWTSYVWSLCERVY